MNSPENRPPPTRPPGGDWATLARFVLVAAVMTVIVIITGSAEAAVMVGSALGALLRR
jgi:hypothetical protein